MGPTPHLMGKSIMENFIFGALGRNYYTESQQEIQKSKICNLFKNNSVLL